MDSNFKKVFYGEPTRKMIEAKIGFLSVNSTYVWHTKWSSHKPVLRRKDNGGNKLKEAREIPVHCENCSERCASYILMAAAAVEAYCFDLQEKSLKRRSFVVDAEQKTFFENGHICTEISLVITRVL